MINHQSNLKLWYGNKLINESAKSYEEFSCLPLS